MARPQIHVMCSADPLIPGGSLMTKCKQPIHKSYVVRLLLKEEVPEKPWRMCKDCWNSLWDGRYNALVCEADVVPDLLLEVESCPES